MTMTEISCGYVPMGIKTLEVCGISWALRAMRNPHMSHGKSTPDADLKLAEKLVQAGDEHAKAVRGMIVYFELTCQVGWFVEWDTYRHGKEVLSTSSMMHSDALAGLIGVALAEEKQALLPITRYTQTCLASYQCLRRVYKQRRHHRHPDWQIFCNWIETLPHARQLILPRALIRGSNHAD
jgi:hypothetical protein